MINPQQPLLLAVFCMFFGLAPSAPAQPVPDAVWACGEYDSGRDGTPVNMGTAMNYSHVFTSWPDDWGTYQEVANAHVVFSKKGFTYDDKGNVIDSETITRPSASASVEVSWTGDYGEGYPYIPNPFGHGSSAYIYYSVRVAARTGAPEGEYVPLKVRVMGFARSYTRTYQSSDHNSFATAESVVSCWSGQVRGKAAASYGTPYAEYDNSMTVSNPPDLLMSVYVLTDAWAFCQEGNESGYDNGSAEAFADPDIQIDPAYPYKDYFTIEYSPTVLFTPPSFTLSVQNTSGPPVIQLTAPTSHVYELQAALDCPPTNWQAIVLLTNITGTILYTDNQAPAGNQQFYRARAVSIVRP